MLRLIAKLGVGKLEPKSRLIGKVYTSSVPLIECKAGNGLSMNIPSN
jgi:hypothetical protein